MSLPNATETVTAASRSLCLLSDVKTELGIGDSSKDARLNTLIRAASSYIAHELGRPPWLQTYLERRPGDGGVYLYVSRWPIQTITSITQGTGSSPTTIDSGDYSIAQPSRDRVYKAGGWNQTDVDEGSISPGSRALEYNITYAAGWVMPDQVTTWAANTAVSALAWYRPTDLDHPLIFQADSDGGTTGGTEPGAWATVVGGTTTDNDITWTGYAQGTPFDLEEAALMLVMDWYNGGLQVPSGVSEESVDSWRVKYREQSKAVSSAVSRLIGGHR